MRILVLGGSLFLSRAIAAEAARRGHDVTAACRGTSPVPQGVAHAPLDRSAPDWSVIEGAFDAVVDTQSRPDWVAQALEEVADRAAHWTYVSSISVYADQSLPGGSPATLEVVEPEFNDDTAGIGATYGARKVACEQFTAERAGTHLVVRPGLIVGPGDSSGRFTSWPVRLDDAALGEEVLAPGAPDDLMQVIDVRDQAAWHVDAIEAGLTGTIEAVGPRSTMRSLLEAVAVGVGADVRLTWVPGSFLADHDVEPWMGPASVAMWLPRPDHDGMVDHDDAPIRAAGLTTRPLVATAADTLRWARAQIADGESVITGISRDKERRLLEAWHRRSDKPG